MAYLSVHGKLNSSVQCFMLIALELEKKVEGDRLFFIINPWNTKTEYITFTFTAFCLI